MIDLTPIDVRKKKGDFKRAVRGYDTDLVDDFLDLVAERLEELVKQNMSLTDRLGRVEEQVGEYRQRDRALTEALVTAQEVREEVRRQAEKDAQLVHREAEADAAQIRAEAAAVREREEESLRRLRARRLHMIQSFRTFLERELNELAVTQETLDMEEAEPAKAQAAAVAQARGKAAAARHRAPDSMEEPMTEARAEAPHAPEPEAAPAAPAPKAAAKAAPRAAPKSAAPPAAAPGLPLIEDNPAPAAAEAADSDGPDWLSSIMEEKP